MAPRRIASTSHARLMEHLFGHDGGPANDGAGMDPVADELSTWMATLPRFRTFVDAHRDKIRKKLRLATDPDARKDVRAELLVARRLLADRNMELAFEPGGVTLGGPDFGVRYRGRPSFNLEVTRPRRISRAADGSRLILAKLHQLPTSAPNLLLMLLPAGDALHGRIGDVVRGLRRRADAKDEDFFTRRGFAGTQAFYDRFLRLSAVVTYSEATDTAARAERWINPSARIPVPDDALGACLAGMRAG
jgi:hypothetical protein